MTHIAIQDGPDFYVYANGDDEEPVDVIHAPFAFNDGDAATAQQARQWFKDHHPDVSIVEAA